MANISKLESATRHLAAAVRLFLEEQDPIVVHTVAAAAQGTLRDIARATHAPHQSILHDHPEIRPEDRKRWVTALNAPRNFFKHADSDPDGTLEFDEESNVDVLLDAVLLHSVLSDEPLSEAAVFMGWFTTANPSMRKAVSSNTIGEFAVRNGLRAHEKMRFRELVGRRLLVGR